MDDIQELKIVITEPGSEAFYRETVNVMAQYRRLLKKPERKLKNIFKTFRNHVILMIVLLAVMIAVCAYSYPGIGFDPSMIVVLVLPVLAGVLNAVYLRTYSRIVKRFLSEHKPTTVTLDAQGIENRTDSQTVRLAWDNIAFARVFEESIGFLSSNGAGIVMSVDRRYAGEITRWLGINRPDVKIVAV